MNSLRVATSPDFLESVAEKVLDAAGFKPGDSWQDTIGLEWDTGGIVFLKHAHRWYSAHLVFLPKTKDIAGKCRQALNYLFTKTDCYVLTGEIPVHLKHAVRIAAKFMPRLPDKEGLARFMLIRDDYLEGN